MSKIYFSIVFFVFTCTLTACNLLSPASNSSGLPQALTHEWTIETGDIDALFVAENGNIYGFVYSKLPRRHITFNPNGELINVVELPYDERMLDRYLMYQDHFSALPDGTILIDDYEFTASILPDHTLIIFPEAVKPYAAYNGEISKNGDGWAYRFTAIDDNEPLQNGETVGTYIFFDIDKNRGLIEKARVTVPNISDYSMYAARDELSSLVYENTLGGNIIFYNRDGKLVYDKLPDGLDFTRRYFYYLTPWGDLWLKYNLYDAAGVDQGQVILRIDQNGQAEPFSTFPLDNFESYKISYHANADEVYYYGNSTFQVLNRDFEVLETFIYPANSAYGKFMGFDGNFYVWNKGKLSKYSR